MSFFDFLLQAFNAFTWKQGVMIVIGGLLIYLAIRKKMEPALLLPIGFGAILVNLPLSGVLDQVIGEFHIEGVIRILYDFGIKTGEIFPLLLFIGIGAMIDFGPLLASPKLIFFGAAAQLGIFITLIIATLLKFDLNDAASIAMIGAADGPTAILVANVLHSKYTGAIVVVAYSYMALVPIVQPAVIKLVTTKKERRIRMSYSPRHVSKTTKILFPIVVTLIAGIIAPQSVALVGFLMFGNLIRECGVLDTLSETAQSTLVNLITLLLGISISFNMQAESFLTWEVLAIVGLGLAAFVFDTIGGVMFAKFINLFTKNKINPMVGAAGISAFPMSARVVQKLGLEADPENHLLMHAVSANVSGQIASVLAGGVILSIIALL
jgi:sodium ion-translocating decarboxylase beta subunit